MGELSESIRKLIDSWRVMRVMTLAYNVLSKRFPVSGWELDLVVRLYQAYAVSRYKDVFTPFAIEEWRKAFDHIFKLSISTGMSYGEFMKVLMDVDEKSGVFITAHWLTCIFDYQEKSEFVWAHFPIFYSIAHEIHGSRDASRVIKRYVKKRWIEDPYTGLRFRHRYHKAATGLLTRAIENLCKYGGTLTLYIDKALRECGKVGKRNWIRLMTAALNMLTYDKGARVGRTYMGMLKEQGFFCRRM
ncbi:MAG: hypothetical protein ACTSXX_04185 [Candidatus Baldrarchaeia archaeon]